MQTFKIGQKFYYTGDMANIPGIAKIIEIKSSIYYGKIYNLKIENDSGESRIAKGITATAFEKSPGRRFIPWEEYQEEREIKIARLEEYMKNKPANFHSQCVKNQVLSAKSFI